MKLSVSATTRTKRDSEKHGADYYFMSVDEFRTNIEEDRFIEWEEVYHNQYYGTLKSEINNLLSNGMNIIFDVDAVGGINIKRFYKEKALSVFISPPSIEVLEKRLTERKTETDKNLKRRIKKAKLEMSYASKFDKSIINNNLEDTYKEIKSIIEEFLHTNS
jgi:guanylate kinase